jgi:hypothetical protein
MDVEFINVNYPIKKSRQNFSSYKFPCIFSSIIWDGRTEIIDIDIKVFVLPCHYCKENCKDFKNHGIKHGCIFFAQPFIVEQIKFIEELLLMYEDFKLYSYGKSDFKQLEFSDSFFQNSMEKRTYKRKIKKKNASF